MRDNGCMRDRRRGSGAVRPAFLRGPASFTSSTPPPFSPSLSLLPPLFLYFRRRNFLPVCLVLRQSARRFKAQESSLEMCDITAGPGQWRLGRAITQATPPPLPPPRSAPLHSALLRLSLCGWMMSCFSRARLQAAGWCRSTSERLWPHRSETGGSH